jgi:DNA-binding NarL/FixJ family response regulator
MMDLVSELRQLAIAEERENGVPWDLALLWHDLTCGRSTVVDPFFTNERCYLLVTRGNAPTAEANTASERFQILKQLLCGRSCKAVAFDLGLALSTVAQRAKQALQQIGVTCTPNRVHPLIALAAQATQDQRLTYQASATGFLYQGQSYLIVGLKRPEAVLAPMLPPAELAVVGGLLEGRQYAEIARSRGTSTRTIANQLAAAFRRMGISGRGSLVGHLVRVRFDARV